MSRFSIKDLAADVAEATDWNNHTEARLMIAQAFNLKKYETIFDCILQIQDISGSMHPYLDQYRSWVSDDMMIYLEKHQSAKTMEMLYNAL